MEKRIFEENASQPMTTHQAKQEFIESEVVIEEETREVDGELIVEESLRPPRVWVRVLLGAFILFGIAVMAQSIQWLIDTWQANRWIAFAFAVAFFTMSLAGIGAIVSEWQKLRWLRYHHQQQTISRQMLLDSPIESGEKAQLFCKSVLANLNKTSDISQAETRWLSQLEEGYNSKEVLYLFSENVLAPLDAQAKKLISKSAVENAIIVMVSPLAWIDVMMTAWRNIALVNKITQIYGMELGYISRLKLFKMVLTNMVFAGATEVVNDVGMEFFSQNLTAKLSLRAAQGMGVGLLTARLGIKAMEFCRPVAFQKHERPSLSVVRQTLLTSLKNHFFTKSGERVVEKNVR